MNKLIFIDVDGTLFCHSTREVPASASETIETLVKQGHQLFICTGRSIHSLVPVADIPYDGIIASAGAYVVYKDEVLYQDGYSDVKEIVSYLNSRDICVAIENDSGVYLQDGAKHYFHTVLKDKKTPAEIEEYMVNNGFYCISDCDLNDVVYKMTVYAPSKDELLKAQEGLPSKYKVIYTGDYGDKVTGELTLSANNKATGIEVILNHLNRSFSDTIGIGDSLNDMEMIEKCAIGIAMGNSVDELKNIADVVTSDIGDNGFRNAFKTIGLI